MFKRLWKKLNQTVSAPIWCYLLLIALSLVLVGVPMLFSESNVIYNILTNFGYGIFGSTFVGILIDYGATIRQHKNDRKVFYLMTRDLKGAIYNLIEFRKRYNHVLPEKYREISYVKWIYKIANVRISFDKEFMPLLVIIRDYFKIILDMAEMVDDKSSILIDNMYLPENFIYNLGQLILYVKMVLGNERLDEAKSFDIGITMTFSYISLLFPEYKSIFFENWNSSEDLVQNDC